MDNQFIFSLLSAISISASAAYLGALMLQKRMALAAGPLGHLALPGVALALLFDFNISLGAFPFVILGILLIWLLEIKTKLPTEALTAVVFAGGVAISFLFLPIEEAEVALVGNITTIGWQGTLAVLILSLAVFITTKKIFSKMMLMNISEDLANIEKINIKKYNLIYLFAMAIIVSLGVRLVGGLLTAALVSIPPATARNFSNTLKSYAFLSILFGFLPAIIGLLIFKFTQLPAGILIIITSTIFFILSTIFKKNN